jgi:lipoyl(octanoyl) transferase
MANKINIQDLGVIPFKTAWDYQYERQAELINPKLFYRDNPEAIPPPDLQHFFLWCEHQPVYTLGKAGKMEHLLLDTAELAARQIDFYKINRGGDITFHGLGQVVGYPIFDLEGFFLDIGKYVRFVEEAAIRTCAEYGVVAARSEGESGAWVSDADGGLRKICAVGIHLSRWVTMHGFAFNVNTDLAYFKNIVPCGITDKGVTSLATELGRTIDQNEVKAKLLHHYQDLFGGEWRRSI